ncbi:hypothetical protein AQUSIP_10890 [Aquicella siphonis]|uniref:Uncharacterized protein n=1 Tax=Aquicella siphonis TaxID=254247 RepID=A0A5E4PH62_9COXI|nr:hypothetical protein [Aquicella siphonis]VVC75792.1 hypothetical protein AQUSIP_10890 [Aquicella siphonis]
MDPRHESFKQGLLNHVISTINSYMKDNMDAFVASETSQEKARKICKHIYQYLGVAVDVDGIISKHNLLSIDVVMLPVVDDPEARKILKQDTFLALLEHIHGILQQPASPQDDELSMRIHEVLTQYMSMQ